MDRLLVKDSAMTSGWMPDLGDYRLEPDNEPSSYPRCFGKWSLGCNGCDWDTECRVESEEDD